MPIREYTCIKCGVFENIELKAEEALKNCPKCNNKVERIMSLSSIRFNGSGYYLTDYKSPTKAEKKAKKKDDNK